MKTPSFKKQVNKFCPAMIYVHIYPKLIPVARRHGYAIAVHGSCKNDFDLIAVPWVRKHSTPLRLALALTKCIGGHLDNKIYTNHEGLYGRVIHLGGHLFIDLNIMEV